MSNWPLLQQQYFSALEHHFQRWSERYTDLRLTTDIRVATWRGKGIKKSVEVGQWWFRDALGAQDKSGKLRRERLVILGDPGGGKSTACQRMSWEFATAGRKEADSQTRPVTPLYLELGAYRSDATELQGFDPYQRMLKLLASRMGRFLTGERVNWDDLSEYMESGPFLFFLDGLNEVGQNHRQALIKDIRDFIKKFAGQGHQFVLTTRKFDYEYDFVQHFPTDDFEPLEILELDDAGVNEFIMRDLGQISHAYALLDKLPPDQQASAKAALDALKRGDVTTDQDRQALLTQAQQRFADLPASTDIFDRLTAAQNLLDILRGPDYQRLLWLAQNPGTLRDIIDVYQDKATIPRSRTRLSEQAIQARLRIQAARRVERNEPSRFPQETKFAALQAVAFQMIDVNKGLNITHQDIIAIFEKHVRPEEAQLLLKELIFSDTLLVEPAEAWYAFVKQPYQEYFVARELRDRWLAILEDQKDPLRDSRMQRFLRDRAYWQVTSAMAGLLNEEQVTSLVTGLWKKKSTQRLAALCVRNAEELPSYLINKIINKITNLIYNNIFIHYTIYLINFLLIIIIYVDIFMFIVNYTFDFLFNIEKIKFLIHPLIYIDVLMIYILYISIYFIYFYIISMLFLLTFFEEYDFFSLLLSIVMQSLIMVIIYFIANFYFNLFYNSINYYMSYSGISPYNIYMRISMNKISLIDLLSYSDNNFTKSIKINIFKNLLAWFAVIFLSVLNKMLLNKIIYILNNNIVKKFEALRYIGPSTTFAMIEIQQKITNHPLVPERIKEGIERTLTPSPRTIMKIIENIKNNKHYNIKIKDFIFALLQHDTDYATREKGVDTLFHFVQQAVSIDAVSDAIDGLGKLALEEFEYRHRVSDLLKQVISNPKYPLNVRRKALQACKDLGSQDVPPLRLTLQETLSTWRMTVVVMLSLCAVVFGGLWWTEQLRWWIGFGLAGLLLLAIANIGMILSRYLWIAYYYNNQGITCSKQGDYRLAIANFTKAIELNPYEADYYNNRGDAYYKQDDYERAITDFSKAIKLDPNNVESYYHRGVTHKDLNKKEKSVYDFMRCVELKNDGDWHEKAEEWLHQLEAPLFYYHRGLAYNKQQNYEQAISDYSKAIELDSNQAWAYNERGLAYSKQGKHKLAIADYTRAIELNHEPLSQSYNNRGDAYSERRNYHKAIAEYSKAIELNPDYVFAYDNRGNAYYAEGEYTQAIANYSKVIELDLNYARSYSKRGDGYSKQGQHELAIADYTKAIELDHEPLSQLYYNRGNAYQEMGDYEQAIADYSKAIELDHEPLSQLYYNRGNAYQEIGNDEQAIADYTKVIELKPYNALFYHNRGDAYHRQGNYEQALADYMRELDLTYNAKIRFNRRGIHFINELKLNFFIEGKLNIQMQGNYTRAIANYTKAIALDPYFAVAYKRRGWAYAKQGNYAEAITDCTRAIELDPNSAVAYNNRGWAYAKQGNYAQAITDCTRAIELAPDLGQVYHSRGVAYLEQGDYERAITDFNRSLELKPDLADSYSARGYAYYEQGDYTQAIADSTKAIELNSDYAEAYYHRGVIYQELGDFNAAMTNYQRCLALNPEADLRKKAEKRLRELDVSI